MATRYGNGGGRGRRITDFEDEPLTDEVEKGIGLAYVKAPAKAVGDSLGPVLSKYNPDRVASLTRKSNKFFSNRQGDLGVRAQNLAGKVNQRVGRSHSWEVDKGWKENSEKKLDAYFTKHPKQGKALIWAAETPRGRMATGAAGGAIGGGTGPGLHRREQKKIEPEAAVGKAARYYDPEHRRQRRLCIA